MIIGFRKQFKGTGTYIDGCFTQFREQILTNLKLHTMREDVHFRFKDGITIQMATGVRTKQYDCFKQDTIKSIQRIAIEHTYEMPPITEREFYFKYKFEQTGKAAVEKYSRVALLFPKSSNQLETEIIDRYLDMTEIRELANNDGFSSARNFFHYFNENKTYRLIHWTDLKY